MRGLAFACLLGGCGGDDGVHHLADAPPAFDAIDAETVEALMTLTLTDGGVPAVGATVYFQKLDSAVVRISTTDLDGVASAPMPDGGFVTVVEPRAATTVGDIVIRDRLATFAAVKNGDQLRLDVRPPASPVNITVNVQVTVDPAAENYELYSSCGRGSLGMLAPTMPASVQFTDCAGIADILVTSNDLATVPLRAFYRAGQPVSDGATHTFTEPYVDLVPETITITGTPAWVTNSVVEAHVVSARGPLYPAYANIDPASPMATLMMPVAAGTTRRLRTDFYVSPPAIGRQSIVAWNLQVGDQTIQAGTAALRPFTASPAFDPATRTVTWTEDPGLDPDIVRTEVYTYREGDPARAWSWQIVAPYGDRAEVTFPVLQGEAAMAFTTVTTDSFAVPELETLAISGGYDRIRAVALGRPLDRVPAGAAGQLTYQRLDDQNLLVSPTLGAPATFTRATR